MVNSKNKIKKKDSIDQYTHDSKKRANNPPVGLVTPGTDPDQPSKIYSYDPRMSPQLEWSGKQENSEIEIDTVSLHVHERIDPLSIIEKVSKGKETQQQTLFHYFETPENNPPLRDAIEFYKHDQNWSNRLIAGDSLLVMNSLLEKEGMGSKIQMIYLDPPYGIKYGSNFQPFVDKRDVKDGKDEDLTQEPEMIKAFRDTWELGIHSYLSYLRSRLLLSKELLTDSGSVFVQISDENLHHVREIMDEIFGSKNFVSIITFRRKINTLGAKFLGVVSDYLIWYSKDKTQMKFNKIFQQRAPQLGGTWRHVELANGERRLLTKDEIEKPEKIPPKSKIFASYKLAPAGFNKGADFLVSYNGKKFQAPHTAGGRSWKTNENGMKTLVQKNRVLPAGDTLRFVAYYDDFPYKEIDNLWDVMASVSDKTYAVQTATETIQRCMLMTTEPGDVVFDPTCGSGTTAFVAEQWGRRWITCDTSRIATVLAKQRLMTSQFDYFKLLNTQEGISSGFEYKKTPHTTVGSIANNEPPNIETLYDQPIIQKNKRRISGPFTVEAVPSPIVKSLDILSEDSFESSSSNKETSHQEIWREELLKTGIRGKKGQKIEFSRVNAHPATKWIHADAETKEEQKRVMVSFGPQHAPLEQRQVALAIEEADHLVPKPKMIIFAAMQFDPEAAKDIDELNWPDVTILKVEMNKDLLTEDLKKKRSNNESFWLMGQPDVELKKSKDGKYTVKVNGYDYYDTKTGEVESGDASKISMWMIDTDYDGRSVYPQQVFFPMEGKSGGWNKLTKTLKNQIDEELIEKYQGTESIQFEAGFNKRVAVKIIDNRGIESLKIIKIE
jgi:adenine-specific DNA-methyltransferase